MLWFRPWSRFPPFPPPAVIPPTTGRARRPQASISACRHQTAPCHPMPPPVPPPAGILHSKGMCVRLQPVIITHRLIPTESILNPLLTGQVSLCLSLSMK